MADQLDSGKRRGGFRSAQSRGTGPTGPGGSNRPASGRPSRGPGGSKRPSSGATLGSTSTNVPVRGGSNEAHEDATAKGAPATDVDTRIKQLEADAKPADAVAELKQATDDTAAEARAAADNNQQRARQQARSAYDDEKSVKADRDEALKSAPNANRPVTDEDLNNYTTPQERAAAGPAARQQPGSQSALAAFGSNLKRNRSRWIAGGGIVGVFLALIISFLGLLPLRLESYMKNVIEDRISNRVDHYMEKRSDRLILKFLDVSVGRSDAEFERAIVNYGEPVRDLYRTWRVNKFETKLFEQEGVHFERTGNGIRVFKNGNLVGDYQGAEARAVVRLAVQKVTKDYQIVLRFHLRKWEYVADGITRWGDFFHRVTNTKQDPGAAETELSSNVIDASQDAAKSTIANETQCAFSFGAQCEVDNNDPIEADKYATVDAQQSRTGNANDTSVEGAVNDADQTAADQAKQYIHDLAAKVGNPDAVGNKILARILMKFLEDQLAKDIATLVSASSGPIMVISFVDIGSRIDHFFYNGAADKVVVNAHEVQYANQFANYSTINDEWKDGNTISGDEFNALQNRTNGFEQSQSFQWLYLHNTSGRPLTTTDDGSGGTTDNTFQRSIDEQSHPLETLYRSSFGDIPQPELNGLTWHQFFVVWFNTGGKIWGFIQTIIGDILGALLDFLKVVFPPLGFALNWLTSHLADWFIKLMLWLTGLAVDGTERGADLANGIYAGGTVVGEGFPRNLGAPRIGKTAAAHLDSEIASANAQAAGRLSIRDRIFSLDYSHSLVNTLVVMVPAGPQETWHDSLGYFATLTQNPFRAFAPVLHLVGIGQAQAATVNGADNLFGMNDWGYTDTQLDADDSAQLAQACEAAATRLNKSDVNCVQQVAEGNANPTSNVLAAATGNDVTLFDLNLSDCPAVADPTQDPNVCRLDIATLQAMAANSTADDNSNVYAPGGNP